MFEQLTHDPGEKGLERATRIFYVLAALNLIAVPACFVLYGSRPPLLVAMVLISLTSAGVAYAVGRGVERQQKWAKWLGTAFAVVTMLNVPIGTIIGVFTLKYLNRASKAGLFNSSTKPDQEEETVSPVVRGAMIGAACGFGLLLVLLLAFGRPDTYLGKLIVLSGGGASIGAFIGSFGRKRTTPRAPGT
jgi:hypothetical protein